jgi:hypothetical protein
VTGNLKLSTGPLIRLRRIQSLVELKPFIEMVTTHAFVHNQVNQVSQMTQAQSYFTGNNLINNNNSNSGIPLSSESVLNTFKLFEITVHEDFLEGWFDDNKK